MTPTGSSEDNLSGLSVRERRLVGVTDLSPEEDEEFQRANQAYVEKFDFPLVDAIRDHTKEILLVGAESRLEYKEERKLLISVVEVVKVANYRLRDMVEESPIGARN